MLEDVETVVAAREFIPEGHPVKASLQSNICRSLGKIDSLCQKRRRYVSTKMLCVDQMRIISLFGAFMGLPQARTQVKKILDDEIKNDIDELYNPRDIPGCKDPQAHRLLLGIYSALVSERTENRAAENATIKAILSHNRTVQQAVATSKSHGVPSTVADEDKKKDPETWPVLVKTIKLGNTNFENVSIYFVHTPAVLEFHIEERFCEQKDTKLDLATMGFYNLYHSRSKRRIALNHFHILGGVQDYIIDVSMRTTREGEMLMEKLRVLRPIYTLNT